MAHLTDTDEVKTSNIGSMIRGKIIGKVRSGYPVDLAAQSLGIDLKTLKWWRRHLKGFEKELERAERAALHQGG